MTDAVTSPPPPGDAREPTHDASEPPVVEEKVLTDEDMPPLESLDENSDYSGFLSSGVSESLRRRALRKLFSSAVFNIPDGLDDYDDDFTSFAALGDIVTSDMKHQAEVEAERAKQAQARAEPATGTEEGSRGVEDEQSAPADDDATVSTEAGPADGIEPIEPAAFPDAVPPETAANEDTAGNGERSASPASDEHLCRESAVHAGASADTQAPDDAETRTVGSTSPQHEGVSGRNAAIPGSAGSEESAASAGHSKSGLHAAAGGEAPAKAGKTEPPSA